MLHTIEEDTSIRVRLMEIVTSYICLTVAIMPCRELDTVAKFILRGEHICFNGVMFTVLDLHTDIKGTCVSWAESVS